MCVHRQNLVVHSTTAAAAAAEYIDISDRNGLFFDGQWRANIVAVDTATILTDAAPGGGSDTARG